jgi:DNA-directed RNA polymerase specialized sigma24 family protein
MCLTINMLNEPGLLEILDERSQFEAQFARCRGLVRFAASRLLKDAEEIAEAVENCYLAASRYSLSFEYDGEFRRWLVRIAVDEAFEIRSRKLFQYQAEFRSAAEYATISMQEADPV